MNSISKIRARLGVTQATLAEKLGVTQGNISNYEHGQDMPSRIAKLLIVFADTLGHVVTYEDIYGAPKKVRRVKRRATDPEPSPGHRGRQAASPRHVTDTVPEKPVTVVTKK